MNPRLLALAALVFTAAPLAAGTPQFRYWDLCTPGSFRVCASVSLSLEYVNGPEAVGWSNNDFTRVVVTIANLQGQAGHEGDDVAGIYWAGFSGLTHYDAPPDFHSENNFTGTMQLEGTGSPGQPGSEHTLLSGHNMLFSGPINGVNQFIWGCEGAPQFWVELYLAQPMSCGGTFVLAVNLDSHIELNPNVQPGIGAVHFPTQPDVHPGGFAVCSDRPGDPRCIPTTRAIPATAVPEPATMLLMATGLAGIGGAAIRRRRKVA